VKQEILDLIDIYENKEKYLLCIDAAAKKEPIPDIAEALNLQSKIDFGKNRQRAELLKLNEVFLKELLGIKSRLGEKFLKFVEEVDREGPHDYKEDLIKSDFAEPRVIISHSFIDEQSDYPSEVYYLPGTRIENDDWPEHEISEEDSYFKGKPLEWVVVPEDELFNINIDDPKFRFRCKEKVFSRYAAKWFEFLTKWHISHLWNGDLEYLHVHSLPSVVIGIDLDNRNLPIVIRLGAWASVDDLRKAWPEIERKRTEANIRQETEKNSKKFIRDLVWYQMKKDGMSYADVAHFWADKFPHEILLDITEKITKGDSSFENINAQGKEENVPLEERLKEIQSAGPDDPVYPLKVRLEVEREPYIRTEVKDKVKKQIKSIEGQIKRLSSEEWDINQERLFQQKMLRAMRSENDPLYGEK
jgi:hypothetical protein